MAVEIGTAYVSIVPSARGFGASLNKAIVPEAAAAGDQAGVAASGAFGRRLTLGIAAAVAAASVGLVALGKKASTMGLKTAAANEQAAISFEKFTGSAQGATVMLRDLKKFAAETPFEFPELQEASRMMLVAGISAEKVMPMMRNLGDVVSSTGKGSEGLQRAAIAIQQMSAAGRIFAEDLNQLRDAGVPVFELLQGATGKTKEEITEMAREGKLGGKELQQVFDALVSGKGLERFTGLMERQSRTLLGLWSTLKDNIGQGLAEAMAPAVESIKLQMPAINDAVAAGIGQVGPVLTSAVSELIHTASVLLPVIAPMLASLGSVLVNFLSGLAKLAQEMGGMFAFLASVIASEVIDVFSELIPEITALAKALGPVIIAGVRFAMMLSRLVAPVLAAILREAEPLVRVFGEGIARAFFKLAEADLSGMFEAVLKVMDALDDVAMPLLEIFLAFVNQVAGELGGMLPSIVDSFLELGVALLPLVHDFAILARDVGPILLSLLTDYLPIILRTIGVLIPLWVAWTSLRALWADLWLRVLVPFIPLLAHLAEVLLPLLERVLVPLVEGFTKLVMALGETKLGAIFLTGAIAALIALKMAGWALGALIPMKSLLGVIQLVTFALAFKTAWQGGEAIASTGTAAQIAAGYVKKFAESTLAAATSTWILTAAQAALDVVLSPWFLIPAAILAVAAAVLILYQDVKPFHDLVDSLWVSFQAGLDVVRELFGLLLGGDFAKAGQIVSDLGGVIVDSLASLGNLIKDKVTEWALAALTGLANVGAAIWGWLTTSLGPLLIGALSKLGQLFFWWLVEALPFIYIGLARIWLALNVWVYTTVLPWLVRAGWNLLLAFIGWIKEAVPAALEALGGFLLAIGPWFTGTAIPWLQERAAALADAFTTWVSETIGPLLEQLGGFLSELGNWITGTAVPTVTRVAGELGLAIIGWLADIVPKLLIGLGRFLVAFYTWVYGTAVPALFRASLALLGALLHFVQEAPGFIVAGLNNLVNNIGGWIVTAAVWLAEHVVILAVALWGWIVDAVPTVLDKLAEWRGAIGEWITGTALPWLAERLTGMASAFWEWVTEVRPKVLAALGGFLLGIGKWVLETAVPFLINKGLELLAGAVLWIIKLNLLLPFLLAKALTTLAGWISDAAGWFRDQAPGLALAFLGWAVRLPFMIPMLLARLLWRVGEWIVAAVPWLFERGLALVGAILGWVHDAIAAMPGLLLGFALNVANWIIDFVPWLIGKVGELEVAVLAWLVNAAHAAPGLLAEWGEAVLSFIRGLPEKITDAAKDMWVGVTNAFIAAINWIIRTWNALELKVPEVDLPGIGKVGGFTLQSIDVSELPYLKSFAAGGRPPLGGPSLVGERGPELFWPDRAGTIVPNDALGMGAPSGGLTIGKVEVSGQERPAETAFALRRELRWLALTAGAA